MSTAGWIFLVGMRVIDVGGLIVWLVWFYRHQEDDPGDDWSDWDDPGDGDRPSDPPRGPGGRELDLPLPDAGPWSVRVRDHGDRRPVSVPQRRGAPEREREPVTSAS